MMPVSVSRQLTRASAALAILGGLAAVALTVSVGKAQARQGLFPSCHEVPVEMEIIRDFNWAEEKTWHRGFEMVRLTRMHEHRTVRFRNSEVTRRYCMADAHFTNGHHRQVYYMIEDVGGFVGRTWEVTHCVLGLDPWRVHDGNCRTMR